MKTLFNIAIYILGYICSYYSNRKYIKEEDYKFKYSWEDVIFNLLISMFSWGSFIFMLFMYIPLKFKNKKSKIPKWL